MSVKGQLNFSCKSTTAANVDLTESLLDNWLKYNRVSGRSREKRSNFAGFLRTNSRKKRPISRELSRSVLLKKDW